MPSPFPSPLSSSEVRAILTAGLETFLSDCDAVSDRSAFGQTFNDLETFFIDRGPKFLQEALQLKVQERIDQTEATPEAKQCSECKKKRPAKTGNRKR